MKKLVVILLAVLCLSTLVWAQVWQYDSDFKSNTQPHGIVVDPDGKIWIGYYGYTDSVLSAKGDGTYKKTKPIWVFNADGTEATFSPINIGTFAGVPDTMENGCRGMSMDNNGNILYSAYDELFRFNYQTGEGMNKVIPKAEKSLTAAAVTADNYLIIGHVGGGNPIHIFDTDFAIYSFVEDTNLGLQRCLLVSADGKDVYVPKIYSGCNGVVVYHGDDGIDGEYVRTDTLGTVFNEDGTAANIMCGQCLNWGPNGLMWVGTYWDVGVHDFTGWYALDPTQNWAIVDTIGHSLGKFVEGGPVGGGAFYSPRGIAWTADGKTAFINDFDGNVTMKFTNASPKGPGSTPIPLAELVVLTGIKGDNGQNVIAVDFKLNRNFPNPFNPSTTIPFELNNGSIVKLTIYDMLGREVATLVNERLNAGMHSYKFDASGYASGTYIYCLEVNGQQVSKSMLYLK
ncbi:MAG: T9SS type A sorting domain-containing protein [Candidatus Marinimicrobia bacterium]|nr:T9SS type A sorting domain-containing protein [Candidatus Neomarinimicrobiota bacterium]